MFRPQMLSPYKYRAFHLPGEMSRGEMPWGKMSWLQIKDMHVISMGISKDHDLDIYNATYYVII